VSDDKKAWWNSTLAKSLGGLIIVLTGSIGVYLNKPAPKKEGGGNLETFINGDYTSYKEWASNEISKLNEKMDAANHYIDMQRGADVARAEYREELRRIESEHTSRDEDREFTKSYYAPQKITILVNKLSGKVYYDTEDGNRHPLSWSMRNGNRIYFIRQNGVNIEL